MSIAHFRIDLAKSQIIGDQQQQQQQQTRTRNMAKFTFYVRSILMAALVRQEEPFPTGSGALLPGAACCPIPPLSDPDHEPSARFNTIP